MLGHRLITKQSGAEGLPCNKVCSTNYKQISHVHSMCIATVFRAAVASAAASSAAVTVAVSAVVVVVAPAIAAPVAQAEVAVAVAAQHTSGVSLLLL
jgi:hypothetical protein